MTAPLAEDSRLPTGYQLASQAEPLLPLPPAPAVLLAPSADLSPTPSGLSSLLGSLSPPKTKRGEFETG